MRWLPFQLNPDLPAGGMPRREYIERKWGAGRGPEVYARVAGAGRTFGLPLAFENITVQPNTLESHRLMHYAAGYGRQNEMAEELFKAYFIEGANLADANTLADVAARAGLDREKTAAYLASDADRDQIKQADLEARGAGIGGVPFFIFNGRVGVSGAQDEQTLLAAMKQAQEQTEP